MANDIATEIKKPAKATLADAAIQSDLQQLGWRIEKLDSGWSAYEVSGDRKIGPAASLKALQTQVNLASGPPRSAASGQVADGGKENGKTPADAKPGAVAPEQRLPTMEEPEIDELNALSDRCINAKEEKERANAAFKDECDVMREKMCEHERKRYTRRGFTLTIEDSEKLVIKKAEAAPARNPSTKDKAAAARGVL